LCAVFLDRDAEIAEMKRQKAAQGFTATLSALPSSLAKAGRSDPDAILAAVLRKVEQRSRDPTAQYREAYRMFGSPSAGLSATVLKERLCAMGLVYHDDDIAALYSRFHESHGTVPFQEVAKAVFSSTGFVSTTPAWSTGSDVDVSVWLSIVLSLALV
jgi:hypothetical protein